MNIYDRFGRWTVIEPAQRTTKMQFWRCRCDCGNIRDIQQSALQSGTSQSCGCLRLEMKRGVPVHVTHGQSMPGSPHYSEYKIWAALFQRCYNPNWKRFAHYGGRGIAVCDRWRSGFEHFIADMGPRPSTEHSIDHINNNGPYSPENCRWATRHEQHAHTRRTHAVVHDGQTLHASEWSRRFGLPRHILNNRLKHGWSFEKATTTPVREWHRHR